MNFHPIDFNASEAEKSGVNSQFFDGNSEQLVKITRAEFVASSNTGAQGIEFDVVNKDGQKGYFTLWHMKGDGTTNEYTMRTLQALMGVTGTHRITPESIQVNKYSYEQKQEIKVVCINAKELIGKVFTGLFVEVYSLYNGEEKKKIELFQPFSRERKSYREINANTPAQDIEHATDAMLKKSAKSKADVDKSRQYGQPGSYGNGGHYAAAKNGSSMPRQTPPQQDSFDDEMIPF